MIISVVKRLRWAAFAAVAMSIEPAAAETAAAQTAATNQCVYVSSYHSGHEWNDRIEKSLEAGLQSRCELTRFYIDSLRHPGDKAAAEKGAEAKQLIDQLQPRVVIACDDSASRHLVMPHLRDAAVPVVFCGVNETVQPYGYPYANTTGIIEVAPFTPLFDEVRGALGAPRRAVFIGADTPAQRRELARFQRAYADKGLVIDSALILTMRDWEQAFLAAQGDDFVILSDATVMRGWNESRAVQLAQKRGKRLSITMHESMSRVAALTMVKVPEEHGEWAANAALAILCPTSVGGAMSTTRF
jgi:hypothetical protein